MYRVLKSHSIKILKDILNIQISPSPLPSPLSSLPSAEPTPTSVQLSSVLLFISPPSSLTPSLLQFLFHSILHFATSIPNSTVVAASVWFCSTREKVSLHRPKKVIYTPCIIFLPPLMFLHSTIDFRIQIHHYLYFIRLFGQVEVNLYVM